MSISVVLVRESESITAAVVLLEVAERFRFLLA